MLLTDSHYFPRYNPVEIRCRGSPTSLESPREAPNQRRKLVKDAKFGAFCLPINTITDQVRMVGNNPENSHQSSKTEKCRKATNFGPFIQSSQVVSGYTDSSTMLTSTLGNSPKDRRQSSATTTSGQLYRVHPADHHHRRTRSCHQQVSLVLDTNPNQAPLHLIATVAEKW